MNYQPKGRAGITIAIIKAIYWLIATPLKWLWKKIREKYSYLLAALKDSSSRSKKS